MSEPAEVHLRVCGSAILVCSHLRTSEEFTHDSIPNSGACDINSNLYARLRQQNLNTSHAKPYLP